MDYSSIEVLAEISVGLVGFSGLTWSLSPLSAMVFVALILAPWRWPQQNLAIYEAAIGFSLLVSLIYFIRLVVSTGFEGGEDDA